MTYRKNIAATQVRAETNSYMLPHGARCTAKPRVTTATRWARMPTTLNVSAIRTQGPACQAAASAGTCRAGRATARPRPGVAAASGTLGPPEAPSTEAAPESAAPGPAAPGPAAPAVPTAPAAPTVASSAARLPFAIAAAAPAA